MNDSKPPRRDGSPHSRSLCLPWGIARASRVVFGALAEHTFRSARAPTGAAEAAALPDGKHVPSSG